MTLTARPVALFGGSFDPVHNGHIGTAIELADRLQLDRLFLLPAGQSPLKPPGAPAIHRMAMLQLAVGSDSRLAVDGRELIRPYPSYTIDTLRDFRQQTGHHTPILFILGMDSFLSLERWHHWQSLTDFAHLLVVTRPGHVARLQTGLAEWLNGHRCEDPHLLEYSASGQVAFIETRPHDVSSSAIRKALAAGITPESLPLPAAVARYIRQHQLYGATSTHEFRLQL